MKALLLILILLLFVASCGVEMEYDLETKKIKYSRRGPQRIGGAEVLITDPNGVEILITFDKQESDGYAGVIMELLKRIPVK